MTSVAQESMAQADIQLIDKAVSILKQQLKQVRLDIDSLNQYLTRIDQDTLSFIEDLVENRLTFPTPQRVVHVPQLEWLLSRPRIGTIGDEQIGNSKPISIHIVTPLIPTLNNDEPPLFEDESKPPVNDLSESAHKNSDLGLVYPLHVDRESDAVQKHRFRLLRERYHQDKFGVTPSVIRNATGRMYRDQAIESIESLVNAARLDANPSPPQQKPVQPPSIASTPSNSPTLTKPEKSTSRSCSLPVATKRKSKLLHGNTPPTCLTDSHIDSPISRKIKRKRMALTESRTSSPDLSATDSLCAFTKQCPSLPTQEHKGIQCSRCVCLPILGDRYTCRECFATDLCSKCYEFRSSFKNEHHDPAHRFRKVIVFHDPDES